MARPLANVRLLAMNRSLALGAVGMAACLAACGGGADEGVALQAAGILAAVERTEEIHGSSFAERTGTDLGGLVLCVGLAGEDVTASVDYTDPPRALLNALEAAGRAAVAGSTCEGAPGWTPDSDEPPTLTADGAPGHVVWVAAPDVEAGRVQAGTLHWYMMPHDWECTAEQVDGAWVIQECQELFIRM